MKSPNSPISVNLNDLNSEDISEFNCNKKLNKFKKKNAQKFIFFLLFYYFFIYFFNPLL